MMEKKRANIASGAPALLKKDDGGKVWVRGLSPARKDEKSLLFLEVELTAQVVSLHLWSLESNPKEKGKRRWER
jgi:hypothetical protein